MMFFYVVTANIIGVKKCKYKFDYPIVFMLLLFQPYPPLSLPGHLLPWGRLR